MTDQEFEIERLRDRICELERDNEALKKEVADLKQKLEQPIPKLDDSLPWEKA